MHSATVHRSRALPALAHGIACALPPAQAQEQLFHARRILGYTYVYAFYMFGGELFAAEISEAQNGRNQSLFEDQQQQLESEVGAPAGSHAPNGPPIDRPSCVPLPCRLCNVSATMWLSSLSIVRLDP